MASARAEQVVTSCSESVSSADRQPALAGWRLSTRATSAVAFANVTA